MVQGRKKRYTERMFFQQANAVTETDPQKMKERLQEALLELQEYKIKYEKALQVSALCIDFVGRVGYFVSPSNFFSLCRRRKSLNENTLT